MFKSNIFINLLSDYQKYKFYILPAMVIVSAISLIGLVIYPQLNKLVTNNIALQGLENKSKQLEVKAAELQNINERDVARKVGIALVALPPDQDYPGTISTVQEVTSQLGFSITSLQIGSGIVEKTLNIPGYSIRVEVLGPESLLNKFLESMESSGRVMKVTGVDVAGSKSGGVISASINIDVYYVPLVVSDEGLSSNLPSFSPEEEQLIVKLSNSIRVPVSVAQPSLGSIPLGKSNPFE